MANDLARCPRAARKTILSTFSRLHEKHLGSRPPCGHPSAADRLWRISGGRFPQVFSHAERVVQEAAARGSSELDLGTVAARWGA